MVRWRHCSTWTRSAPHAHDTGSHPHEYTTHASTRTCTRALAHEQAQACRTSTTHARLSCARFLAGLTFCRTLSLGFNRLMYTLPDSIGRLANLQYVYMNIGFSLPTVWCRLLRGYDWERSAHSSCARYFYATNNNLEGTLPSTITGMTSLVYVIENGVADGWYLTLRQPHPRQRCNFRCCDCDCDCYCPEPDTSTWSPT